MKFKILFFLSTLLLLPPAAQAQSPLVPRQDPVAPQTTTSPNLQPQAPSPNLQKPATSPNLRPQREIVPQNNIGNSNSNTIQDITPQNNIGNAPASQNVRPIEPINNNGR